jgi:hypothetical protein
MTEHHERWGADVHALVEALEATEGLAVFDVEVGGAVDDVEVALVHRRLGFELAPEFLAYFRVCNGVRLRWLQPLGEGEEGDPSAFSRHAREGLPCGSINLPRLGDLFPETMDFRFGRRDDFTADTSTTPFLGGWGLGTLRDRLRPLDDFLRSPDDSSFTNVALVADARFADPVCLFTNDAGAALTDFVPMRARAYLDLVVATAGLVSARAEAFTPRHGVEDPAPIERISRPTPEPGEFLRCALDRLPLKRSREIWAAFQHLAQAPGA